ncbi:hypothetical protein BOX15_Mlig008547g1, partial [Macrostomum lignano]
FIITMATAGPIAAISALAEQAANRVCADCVSAPPCAVSVNVGGAFVCGACAVAHRQAGYRTRSIERDRWQESETAELQGNSVLAETLETRMPPFYRRPMPDDPAVIRTQFVLAKYKRGEFANPARQAAYHRSGGGFVKSGRLMKRLTVPSVAAASVLHGGSGGSSSGGKFSQRLFELSERDNYLRYHSDDTSDSTVRASLPLDQLNVAMVGALIEMAHPHLMMISYPSGEYTRCLYVYHEDGEEIVAWYNAIRGCQYYRLRMSLVPPERLLQLSYEPRLADWLYKTGPRLSEPWRRRWCLLLRRSLLYYSASMQPLAKGELWLGEAPAYQVLTGPPTGLRRKSVGNHVFTVRTPERDYAFSTDSADCCRRWVAAIADLLAVPPTPQDFLYCKKSST